jgi:hypothetical protein
VNLDLLKTGVSDNIVVNGSPLVYGGALSLNLTDTGTAANDTEWQLFSPQTTSGTLGSLSLASTTYGPMTFFVASTSTNPFDAAYGNNTWLSNWSGGQRFIFTQADGVLTVVPEPSTIVFAGIVLGGLYATLTAPVVGANIGAGLALMASWVAQVLATNSSRLAPCSTYTFQGWVLVPLGARAAMSSTSCSTARSTGLGK